MPLWNHRLLFLALLTLPPTTGIAATLLLAFETKDNADLAGPSVPLRLLSLTAPLLEESWSLSLSSKSLTAILLMRAATEDFLLTLITTFKELEVLRLNLTTPTPPKEESLELATSTRRMSSARSLDIHQLTERLDFMPKLRAQREDPFQFASMHPRGKITPEEFSLAAPAILIIACNLLDITDMELAELTGSSEILGENPGERLVISGSKSDKICAPSETKPPSLP